MFFTFIDHDIVNGIIDIVIILFVVIAINFRHRLLDRFISSRMSFVRFAVIVNSHHILRESMSIDHFVIVELSKSINYRWKQSDLLPFLIHDNNRSIYCLNKTVISIFTIKRLTHTFEFAFASRYHHCHRGCLHRHKRTHISTSFRHQKSGSSSSAHSMNCSSDNDS